MALENNNNYRGLQFVSTRDIQEKNILTFSDAVFMGLAPDGGLYYPTKESLNNVQTKFVHFIENLPANISFVDVASGLTHILFEQEFSKEDAKKIAYDAFASKNFFEPKLHDLDSSLSVLELFHGPSCAFKDFGACYLASVMAWVLEKQAVKENKKITILTATSGDTGSAVAQAFFKKKNIEVVILYPSKRVSPLQEKQLTCLGENIHALEIDGSFDDCQALVKQAFADEKTKSEYNLTSANSINIGRLIPQSFYYVYAHNILKHQSSNYIFCTPSGNFGNLSAGLLAWQLGLDVKKFIAATNQNNVIPKFLETKVYEPRASVQTLANAMDVGEPSNFERMQYMFNVILNNSPMSDVLYGAWASDTQIAQTMNDIQKKYNYYVCPHTAAGIYCAKKVVEQTNYNKVVVLATAHAGKFFEVVEQACENVPKFEDLAPKRLALFLDKQKNATKLKVSFDDLLKFLQALNL